MKRYWGYLFPVLMLGSGAALSAQASSTPEVNCTLGGSAVSGMVVHLDPSTRLPTSLPTPEQSRAMEALLRAQTNRSTVGLVEEPGPTGGVQVNLRNRFRSPVVAVRGENGKVAYDHVRCAPAAAAKPAGGDS